MPATVIPVKGIQLGFIGSITHEGQSLREPKQVKATDANPIAFGETLTANIDATNTYSSIKQFIANGGTVTAATPLGIAVSNVKTNTSYNAQGGQVVSGGNYQPGDFCDGLVVGGACVPCMNGTPVAQGPVYIRVALNASIPAGVIGGLEAVADGSNTVLLTNLKWKTGYLETDGGCEVTILTRTIA